MINPLPVNKNGWTDWLNFPKKHQHICCHCLLTHDVQQRVDSDGKIWERWRINERSTSAQRRIWGNEKGVLWRLFSNLLR